MPRNVFYWFLKKLVGKHVGIESPKCSASGRLLIAEPELAIIKKKNNSICIFPLKDIANIYFDKIDWDISKRKSGIHCLCKWIKSLENRNVELRSMGVQGIEYFYEGKIIGTDGKFCFFELKREETRYYVLLVENIIEIIIKDGSFSFFANVEIEEIKC